MLNKKKIKKWLSIEILIIVLLSCIPLFWYKSGYWIEGIDIDFPPDPINVFTMRTYTWNQVLLGGTEWSTALATNIVYMGMQAFLFKLGFEVAHLQMIIFIFWYFFVGFSMYYLLRTLYGNDSKNNVIRISGVIFYMLNFYQTFSWDSFRTAQIFTSILSPIYLALLIKALKKNSNLKLIFSQFAIVAFLCSGIGVHPPSFLSMFILIGCYFLYYLIIKYKLKLKKQLVRDVRVFSLFILAFVLVNSFWIIAETSFIIQSGYTSDQAAISFNAPNLLANTSENNSFLNVLRLYGHLFWFQGWGGERYAPWFENYQTNLILILISFVYPLLIGISFLGKKKRIVIFSGLMVIIFSFLGKGTHAPFGSVYAWLFTHVPGFWIFRAPWQHFFAAGIVVYSVLVANGVQVVWRYIKKILLKFHESVEPLKYVFLLLFLIMSVGYNYVLVLGLMMPSSDGDIGYSQKYNVGLYQKFPDYIFKTRDYINEKPELSKLILLPAGHANVYSWGYGAPGDITLDLIQKPILFIQYGEGTAPPRPIDRLIEKSYSTLSNSRYNISNFYRMISVGHVLQRNDIVYNFYGGKDSPDVIKTMLSRQSEIQLNKTFVNWDVYETNDPYPYIYNTKKKYNYKGDIENLMFFLSCQNKGEVFSFVGENQPENINVNSVSIPWLSEKDPSITTETKKSPENTLFWSETKSFFINPIFFEGWKSIITTVSDHKNTSLYFESKDKIPYDLPGDAEGFQGFNSTLIYINTGENDLIINQVLYDNNKSARVIGVWWETGWVGMGTKKMEYPVVIPKNQKALIQVSHKTESITLKLGKNMRQCSVFGDVENKKSNVGIQFKKVNPTKYKIIVSNATEAFNLIFNDNYHPHWKLYLCEECNPNKKINTQIPRDVGKLSLFDLKYLFKNSIYDDKHFVANGYANGWEIEPSINVADKDNDFVLILNFWPQNLFYLGVIITAFSLLLALYFIFENVFKPNNG